MKISLLAALVVCLMGCKKAGSASGDDVEPTTVAARDVTPRVHLTAADGTEQTVTVEVVREEAEVRRGLMHRRHLAPDAGMLFLMGEDDVHTFWMRNTYIALDMIFIDAEMKVAGIAADTVPHDESLRSVGKPSRYVLEVNAGWSKKHGVGPDAKVRFENIKGVP